MRILPVAKIIVIGLYKEHPHLRPSHPTDGVTAFHESFLYLVCLENLFASEPLSYGWKYSIPHVDPVFCLFG